MEKVPSDGFHDCPIVGLAVQQLHCLRHPPGVQPPSGILPDTVKSFSVASNGYFVIDLYGECYIDFKYVVYYAPRVSGFLGYGSVSNLEGVQIQSYLIWYGVSYIKVDLSYSDFVYIQFG
ncbi:hypothetical protein ZIOFF_035673 [Zingiber officinale]|uniref:Uncharacterized protein n=1 Tax=Zingiber officinale TaxID=94328 RepID=A0A8J5G9Z5_ZINOF|nr:hypothetical protein ZIOFF_035673 [Zingiber officinale]